MKKLFLLLIMLPAMLSADQVISMNTVLTGHNIYGANILYDQQESIYKMWYMGWQNSTDIQDSIYYVTSSDGLNWNTANRKIVLSASLLSAEFAKHGINKQVHHTGDPSITKHYNSTTGTYQYTMFFTMCKNTCIENSVMNENEIWSMVSSDGIKWEYPVLLLANDSFGPAEPHAIIEQSGSRFWKVYYADRLNATQINVAYVNGNRNALSVSAVYNHPADALAGPEVHYIGGQWRLFFTVHRGTGTSARSDIYKASSYSNTAWAYGSASAVIANSTIPGTPCSTPAPGVYVYSPYSPYYRLYFGQAIRRADGICDNTKHSTIESWVLY